MPTETECQNLRNNPSQNQKFKKIKNIITDSATKQKLENKKIEHKLTSDNKIIEQGNNNTNNNQVSLNCNCISKYSYKNTEAITIINKDPNENNIINTNTYFSTERKTFDKSDDITNNNNNNKISNSKSKTKKSINPNSTTSKTTTDKIPNSLSKTKTNNKAKTNLNIKDKDKNNDKDSEKEKENEKLCLDLEILNSWNLPIGLQLHLDQYGLKNSIRNEKDSVAYFGYQTEEELSMNPYIDYLLGPKDQEYDEQFMGKHFQIRYDWDTRKYYIKDLGNGFGTFIKLINETRIKDNMLINIGETYIVFSFNNDNENEIMIKLFTGEEQCNTYTFTNDSQTCIIIGRDSSLCDVIIEDKMLSREHCYINYKETDNDEKGWYIKDGNMKGKKSTNDTWFYTAEETQIYDEMIFKTNHILFKCIYK
jgi:hypothetical protein